MPLYMYEEICDGCEHASWHFCEFCVDGVRFCHCLIDATPNFSTGKCELFDKWEDK